MTSPLSPTPYNLGLSSDPELTWDGIGVAEPTPADLFGAPEGMSWDQFDAAHPKAEPPEPGPELEAEAG